MENEKIIEMTPNYFLQYAREGELERIIKDDKCVGEMWDRCAKEYGDMLAISDGEEYSYKRLNEDVARFRGVLNNSGVKKGQFVGLYIPNSYAFVRAYLAVVSIGAVAVLLPPHLDEKSVYGLSAKFNLAALVYDESLEVKVSLVKSLPVKLLKADEQAVPAPWVACEPSDPCAVLFTGGTTGRSKGVLLSHRAVLCGTINGCYGYPCYAERYLLILPLTHVFGLIRNCLTVLYTGSALRICRNPKDMFREMAIFKPTFLIMVPALAEMGINLSKQLKAGAGLFGGALKYIICGASALAPHLVKEYNDIGIRLLQGYGLTESANLVSGNINTISKPDSVGLPYPGQSLRIVNGELWIKGPNVMTCYLGDEEENKAALEDGWFKTGDLVRIDDEGYIYIVGRIKEVIVLDSGEKISPAELEVPFCTPDYINDAEVFEDFTENGRQILALEVVVRPGFNISKEQVLADMNEINLKLPPHTRVSKIVVRDEDFPRSPSMKKLRKGLNK